MKHLTPQLPKLLIIFSFCLYFSSCILFQPQRIAENAAKEVSSSLNSITQGDSISVITQRAVEGALAGTSSPKSEESISKLSKSLSESLGKALNDVLTNLDTKTPAEKLTKGITESLTSKEFEENLNALLTGVINNANTDLDGTIKNLEKSLNKAVSGIFSNLDSKLSTLDESIIKVMSQTLQDSLLGFINGSLAGIDMRPISKNISTQLLSPELKDTLKSFIADLKKEIDLQEESTGIIETLRKNISEILILLALLIAGGMYLWSRWKVKDKKVQESADSENETLGILAKMMHDDPSLKEKIAGILADKKKLALFEEKFGNIKKT